MHCKSVFKFFIYQSKEEVMVRTNQTELERL